MTYALRSKPGSLNLEEQRPAKCVVHIMCGATADDHEFSQAEDVCGQAWRQTVVARRVASMHLPPDECSQRKPIEPARFHCAPSMAQLSPSLLISSGDFHDGMSTLWFKGTGSWTTTRVPTRHLAWCTEQIDSAREAPPSVSPFDGRPYQTATAASVARRRLLVCRRQTIGEPPALHSNSMRDIAASATSFVIPNSITTFDVAIISGSRTASVLDKALLALDNFWMVSTMSLASVTSSSA